LKKAGDHRMRIPATVIATGLLLAASASSAAAQSAPALVIGDLHHRAGPTSDSPSYGVIPGGTTIEAGPCGGGWCQAFLSGNMGYVSERYLDFGGPPPRGYHAAPPPPPPPVYAPPPYYVPAPPPVYPPYHRRRDSRR
jgi:uncharacterized protein YraI